MDSSGALQQPTPIPTSDDSTPSSSLHARLHGSHSVPRAPLLPAVQAWSDRGRRRARPGETRRCRERCTPIPAWTAPPEAGPSRGQPSRSRGVRRPDGPPSDPPRAHRARLETQVDTQQRRCAVQAIPVACSDFRSAARAVPSGVRRGSRRPYPRSGVPLRTSPAMDGGGASTGPWSLAASAPIQLRQEQQRSPGSTSTTPWLDPTPTPGRMVVGMGLRRVLAIILGRRYAA